MTSPSISLPTRRGIEYRRESGPWRRAPRPLRAAGPLRFSVHDSTSLERPCVERFVAHEFAEHFGARLTTFMPRLLALHGPDRRLVAAVGCRAAAEGALFLEQYLQCPVEATLRARLGAEVPRHRIVEIGNLACRDLRGALAIVQRTIPFLVDEGFTWVVFTAADTLRNVFAHLALEPQPLCRADRDRIARPGEWGTYYEHAPVVVAGRLRDGLRVAARSVADGRDDRSVTTPPGSAVAPRSALPVLGA